MSRVRCLFPLGGASTGSCMGANSGVLEAKVLASSSRGNPASQSFCSSLFSGATVPAKFGTNCQNTLHSPKKDLISKMDMGV